MKFNIVLYLVIGGFIAGLADRNHVQECGNHISDARISLLFALWPAYIAASSVTIKTGERICETDDD